MIWGGNMAKASEVVELLNRYNEAIILMNNSTDENNTRRIAIRASKFPEGNNWGNSKEYLEKISEAFLDVSLRVGTAQVLESVELVNQSIRDYLRYLTNSWWQFGNSDRKNKMSLPMVEELN